jgi:acetone carboxylase gamma subunit
MFTTATAFGARIFARCYYCAHRFELHRDPFGALDGEDREGRLCCEDCFCPDCTGGHATEAEANHCQYLHDYANPVDTDDEFTDWLEQASYGDPDAAYDRLRDDVMDLELTS